MKNENQYIKLFCEFSHDGRQIGKQALNVSILMTVEEFIKSQKDIRKNMPKNQSACVLVFKNTKYDEHNKNSLKNIGIVDGSQVQILYISEQQNNKIYNVKSQQEQQKIANQDNGLQISKLPILVNTTRQILSKPQLNNQDNLYKIEQEIQMDLKQFKDLQIQSPYQHIPILVDLQNPELLFHIIDDQLRQSKYKIYWSLESESKNIYSLQSSFFRGLESTTCICIKIQEIDTLNYSELIENIDSAISLNEFIIYLKSIGSFPNSSENTILITYIQIGQKSYLQDELRNFKQLKIQQNSKVIFYLYQQEQGQKQDFLQQQQQEDERQKLQQEQEYASKQKQLQEYNQIPINKVQIQTQTQLTKVEKELLEEINNTASLIQPNIIDPNQSDNLLTEKQINFIKQEEEILIDTFKCQKPVQKQEDKTFQIIEQQKYHKIENAIKRRIKRNQKNNQIINPLTIEKQKLVDEKRFNQELLMFVLAEQMNHSGKILYQSQQSEDINIFSLQASFSDHIQETLCEKLTLQETQQLTFSQLKDNNNQEKQFYNTIRELLAKQYNVRPEDVNILSIECGSISVKYKITGSYSDADKCKEYTLNEINNYFQVQIQSYIQLSPNDFDPNFNMEWPMDSQEYQMRGPPQDQMKYFFPRGWKGYALKVFGKQDNGNNDWLQMNNNANQWHIMFHGTASQFRQSILEKGLQPIRGQAYAGSKDMRSNQLIGNGVYFSNHIEVCEQGYFRTTLINGNHYKVVFMSRVRPTSLKQVEKSSSIPGKSGNIDWDNDYFVVNKSEDIRPYRILLKKN